MIYRLLIILLVCTPLFALELIPEKITGSYSVRTPNIDGMIHDDHEIKLGFEYSSLKGYQIWELERDRYYLSHALTGRGEWKSFHYEVRTLIKGAKNIDEQIGIFSKRFSLLDSMTAIGIGYGAATKRYDTDKIKGVFDFWLPLPAGELVYTTNFNDIRILDIETRLGILRGLIFFDIFYPESWRNGEFMKAVRVLSEYMDVGFEWSYYRSSGRMFQQRKISITVHTIKLRE